MSEINCSYFPTCRGCDHWNISYDLQKKNKFAHLKNILNVPAEVFSESDFVTIKPYSLRHRFDFTVETIDGIQSMGLFGANRKLVDLDSCLQLSPELQKVYLEFKKVPMQSKAGLIKKASVRLRISPSGKKGCWLDMANIDIKTLLDDSDYLSQLLKLGFEIEMGQKGKKLSLLNGKLKLTDPVAGPWFKTDNFDLNCLISDFTQPSWTTGNALVKVVLDWIKSLKINTAIEFGPGVGQFTLPLLANGLSIRAFENNPKAIEFLKVNAELNHLQKKLEILAGDFQRNPYNSDPHTNCDLALVNPPRSGLKNFVNTVKDTKSRYCIYVSCFPESMQIDLAKLVESGYVIKAAKIVDQFPQTHHYESCVLLERSTQENKS